MTEESTDAQDLMQTFFSPAFGMCVDRFGTPLMVSAPGSEGMPG